MKRFGFIFLFMLLFVAYSISQTSFQNGFILSLQNDTLFGQLENRPNKQNYLSCRFKKDTVENDYSASQIKGFGYINGKCFRSEIVEGEFVEVLVDGFLHLYKHQSVYYLKKGLEVPVKLESLKIEKKLGEENYLQRDLLEVNYLVREKWKGLLSYTINDLFPKSPQIVESLFLNDEDLSKIVIRYNKLKNTDFVEFNNTIPWTRYELGVSVGMEKSILHKTDIQQVFFYLKPEYTSTNPTLGFILGITSPRLSERFSFQPELFLTKVHYDGLIHTTQFMESIFETKLDWISLTMPVTVKYTYPLGNYRFYLQAGVLGDLQLQGKTSYIRKNVENGVITTEPETEAFTFEGWAYGLCGGLGFQYEFKHFQTGLAIRYNQITDIARNRLFEMKPERLSLSLQIITK